MTAPPRDHAPSGTRVLGVLGGMGPLATAYFFERVVRTTPATCDQTHIPTVVWSDGRVPDRTLALQGRGPSPMPMMRQGIDKLVLAGAEVLALPCNTAHAFLPMLKQCTDIPFVNMIGEATATAAAADGGVRTLGILSTTGTRLAQLYEAAAVDLGLAVVHVSWEQQSELIDEAIRIVKRGGRSELAERLVREATVALERRGAEAVVAACTELPLVTAQAAEVLPVVDSVDCLARAVVRQCTDPPGLVSRPTSRTDRFEFL